MKEFSNEEEKIIALLDKTRENIVPRKEHFFSILENFDGQDAIIQKPSIKYVNIFGQMQGIIKNSLSDLKVAFTFGALASALVIVLLFGTLGSQMSDPTVAMAQNENSAEQSVLSKDDDSTTVISLASSETDSLSGLSTIYDEKDY